MTVTLDPAQLEDLAERVAQKLLAVQPADTYDQDHLPTGITRRNYLDAVARGAFPAAKVGRKIVTKREVLDAWMASKGRVPRVVRVKVPSPTSTGPEIPADIAAAIAANGARVR